MAKQLLCWVEGQWPGSNTSVRKLQLRISKGYTYWWEKKKLIKEYHDSNPNLIALHVGKQGKHFVEVGAQAQVFQKIATEPKPYLLRCKNIVKIVTFNVKTLNTLNQLPKLTASVVEHNINIHTHAYIYIYIYILSSTDRLFRCISTL